MAALLHRALGAVFAAMWASLLWQLDVLFGSRGLIPWAPVAARLHAGGVGLWELPSLLRLVDTDAGLRAVAGAGLGLALLALAGLRPRVMLPLSGLLYSGFVLAGRSLFSFQWDNLALECALLAALLPEDRPARWAHLLGRLLLFKLYWESGLCKWQSPLHDWQDGSAMTYYYETAPLPAWPAWYAHHLPVAWHHLESWATLVVELVAPVLFFGPRAGRLLALGLLTGFQALNLATANYGFFVYLALALHLLLLDDADLPARLRARLVRPAQPPRLPAWLRRAGALLTLGAYVALSLLGGWSFFAGGLGPWARPALMALGRLPVINTYHLFSAITRERIEPEFQTWDGAAWQAHDLWHKPGDVQRAPGWVAPHQPRVDFRLWFYGLAARSAPPDFVQALLDRLCHEPGAVQPLFRAPLPEHPEAARVVFWRYHFTTPEERQATGAWWRRELLGEGPGLRCQP